MNPAIVPSVVTLLAALTPSDPLPAGPARPGPAGGEVLPTLVWADFDRDGLDDALALSAGALALFRNAAGGLVEECAGELGLTALPPLSAAGWIDYDRDGAPDVFAVTAEGAPLLLRNESGAAFIDLTEAVGIEVGGPVLKAEWADLDGDGQPDLMVWTGGRVALFLNSGGLFGKSELDLDGPLAGGAGAGPGALVGGGGAGGGAGKPGVSAGAGLSAEGGQRLSGEGPGLLAGDRTRPVGPARGGERGAGGLEAAGAGPGYSTSPGPLPPRSIGVSIPTSCAKFVYDEATQGCVVTSSVAALGQLYPLSSDFNVNSTSGAIGMGTTSPGARLHIDSSSIPFGAQYGLLVDSPKRAATLRTTDPTVAALRIESGDYAAFMEGRLEVGYQTALLADRARVVLDSDANNAGTFECFNGGGDRTIHLQAEDFAGDGARLDLANSAGTNTFSVDAQNGTASSLLTMRMASGIETVALEAEEATGNGAQFVLRNDSGATTFYVDSDTATDSAEFAMYMSSGVRSVQILAEESAGNGGLLKMRNGNSTATMVLDANTVATGGSIIDMYAVNGQKTVEIAADETLGTGSRIVLRKYDGTASIILDSNSGGDGRITTQELEITGGADLVESFDTGGVTCEPGSVLVIDPDRPGELRLSRGAYDRCVAGVVSGAGGVKPGIRMALEGVVEGSTPVALTGRVYVRCTAEGGPIRPGDLLTTSSTEGCAMRAADVDRSHGAVLGKAMSELADGSGLVLTLVNLQ